MWYPLKYTIVHLVWSWVEFVITISSGCQRTYGHFYFYGSLLLSSDVFVNIFKRVEIEN